MRVFLILLGVVVIGGGAFAFVQRDQLGEFMQAMTSDLPLENVEGADPVAEETVAEVPASPAPEFAACTNSLEEDAPAARVTAYRPLRRDPPAFPETCRHLPPGNYAVVMQFDITPQGETENLCVHRTDDPCFNSYAAESAANFLYELVDPEAPALPHAGARTTFRFVLEDDEVEDAAETAPE